MGWFGDSIHNHLLIISTSVMRVLYSEPYHRFLVSQLDLFPIWALSNELCDSFHHTTPPIDFNQVMIHHCGTNMDRIFGDMSFLNDPLLVLFHIQFDINDNSSPFIPYTSPALESISWTPNHASLCTSLANCFWSSSTWEILPIDNLSRHQRQH